jgi:hypothetical protein
MVADRGFTEGVHYFEVKVFRSCKFILSVLYPEDENLISADNLTTHAGAAVPPARRVQQPECGRYAGPQGNHPEAV